MAYTLVYVIIFLYLRHAPSPLGWVLRRFALSIIASAILPPKLVLSLKGTIISHPAGYMQAVHFFAVRSFVASVYS